MARRELSWPWRGDRSKFPVLPPQAPAPKARLGGGLTGTRGWGYPSPETNERLHRERTDAPRNWPRALRPPSPPLPHPHPHLPGMDLAGRRGVVQVGDAGAMRSPQAWNPGGPPALPLAPRQFRISCAPGAPGATGGGWRARGRRPWREEPAAAGAPAADGAELERAAGGGRARRAGDGGAAGLSGGQVPGADPRSGGRAAGGRGGAGARAGAGPQPGWARASGRGLEARGLRGGGCGGAERPAVRGRAAAARPSRAACEAKPSLY